MLKRLLQRPHKNILVKERELEGELEAVAGSLLPTVADNKRLTDL